MTKISRFVVLALLFVGLTAMAQQSYGPTATGILNDPIYVPSIAEQIRNGTIVVSDNVKKEAHPKLRHGNSVVPGKGLPQGNDPLFNQQRDIQMRDSRAPLLVFDADTTPQAAVTDPTGAAGPNHYIGAWNFGFRIFDKSGNALTPEMSLETLFPGNDIGDPIVFFDANIDNGPGEPRGRFVVTEFDNSPNGFNVAVCVGPDPVNDGWHVYTTGFGTVQFPDYTKFAVWGDSYVVTANINGTTNRVFAVERNEMINGNPAQFVGFPLPGISTSGFYSPHAFHTTADQTVPAGTPAPIIYMQDDAWAGVTDDHLQIWEATIDWANPANHSIVSAQEIFADPDDGIADPGENEISVFTGVFDGGSFSNRPQPGGPDVDVIQATVMNQVQYRRFGTHNSVVLNFVVDVLAGGPELAAVRWYELRQTGDGQPWTVYQEGTYTAPDGRDAYSGSMVMNSNGDIALAYTSSSATERISIRYTGRFDGDALGVMTVNEELIAQGSGSSPTNRLADYVHLTNDPADDSFWHIAEYYNPGGRDVVANFVITPPMADDIGVSSIDAPTSGDLTATETIMVSIRNFGGNDVTDPMVQYTIDGGTPVVETYSGTIAAGATESFSFTTTANLSIADQTYLIESCTLLAGDSNTDNDCAETNVTNTVQYCEPSGNCAGLNNGVTEFQLVDQDITTNCGTSPAGFSDDTDIIFTFDPDEDTFDGVLQMGFEDSNFIIWVDFNDNGVFETSEVIGEGNVPTADTDFPFTVDVSSIAVSDRLGSHRMRLRGEDTDQDGDATIPCDDLEFGRTNDYTAFFDPALNVDDSVFEGAEFTLIEREENIYDISLRTAFEGNAAISVYNIIGQQLVFNNLDKEGDAYNYQLDMSYAATGVYIVKFGDVNGGASVSRKIVVK